MASAFICEEAGCALECIVCGSLFIYVKKGVGRLPRFCSPACKAERKRHQVAQYHRQGRYKRTINYYEVKPPRAFACEMCGAIGETKQRVAKYCSAECSQKALSLRLSNVRPWTECPVCLKMFKPSRPNRAQIAAGYKQVHCSRECAGRGAHRSATKRSKQESNLRCAGRWEEFDPLKVFERDGWKCHLCGCKTPKKLRGTTDDRAPELDHIITISDGGPHTMQNTACACRRCNRHKGRLSKGQMLLFG